MSNSASIRWRLVAALAGVSVFTLVVVGLVFYGFLGGYVVDRQEALLLEQAVEVAEQVRGVEDSLLSGGAGTGVIAVLLRADLRVLPGKAGIVVYDGSTVVAKVGSIPARNGFLESLRSEADALGGENPSSGVIRSLTGASGRKGDLLVAVAPIWFSDGTKGLAVVTLTVADAFTARTEILRPLWISGLIAIGLAVLVGWGLGTWMARPIRRLSVAAKRMAYGSYEQPVTGSYPGEVQELASSMEAMRLEVRRSEDSLRGFVASAAHELRTPLTSIQGFSQALLDGTAATTEQQQRSAAAIYRESARLRRLVEALLTLSRYDSHEFEPNMTVAAVDVLIDEEVQRLVEDGLVESGRIRVQVESAAQVSTDVDMLRQVIYNLLRNAVQYGGSDPITVRVWTGEKYLAFEVANGGEPLTEEDRARIFSRFYRGHSGRHADGFGLGLALVWEICEVLGGSVQLVEGGPPTRFRVSLPLSHTPACKAYGKQRGGC